MKSSVQRVTAERDRALDEVRQLSSTIQEQQEQYNQQVPAPLISYCMSRTHSLQCMLLQQQCAQQQEQLKVALEKNSHLQSEKGLYILIVWDLCACICLKTLV